jgi:four helix bundle protein
MGLPGYELYEEGSQLRRCSKSIAANIVEGFSHRRTSKNTYVILYALMVLVMKR